MQNSSIELKSSKYTLTLIMDPDAEFDRILADVRDKFRSAKRFFSGAQMALEFRGRELSERQQHDLAYVIRQSSGLDIICILEKDEEAEKAQYTAITQVLNNRAANGAAPALSIPQDADDLSAGIMEADICPHTIRNGQKVSCDRSILILGDVEPLGEVSSSESIFVAGYALGTLRAGLSDNPKSFAAALVLKPRNVEVCGHKGVSGIRKKTMDDSYAISPQAAVVEDGHLKLTAVSARSWSRLFGKTQSPDDGSDRDSAAAEPGTAE